MFNRRLDKFRNRLRNQSIIDYFNIKSENVEHNIDVLQSDNYSIIKINYYKSGTYFEFPNLPLEINEYIYYFTQTKIKIEVKVEPPENYPFNPPISISFNGRDYLDYCISCSTDFDYKTSSKCFHCTTLLCEYNWSPAIKIKDIVNEVKRNFLKINSNKLILQVIRNVNLPLELKEIIRNYLI